MATKAGRNILRNRRRKGRKRLLPKGAEIHYKRHTVQHLVCFLYLGGWGTTSQKR